MSVPSSDGGDPADPNTELSAREQNSSNEDLSSLSTFVEWRPQAIPENHRTKVPDDGKGKPRNRRTYVSFGDHGTTASINANGHMMQMSRFLGHGRSGFLCVDLADTPEPYYVQARMDRLMELSEDSDRGIRLEIGEGAKPCWEFHTARPSLEFVHDRWPRFTQQTPSPGQCDALDLSLEYFCNEGTVFQRYTWKRKYLDGDSSMLPQFRFDSDLLIRDLDFEDSENKFNNSDEGYSRFTMSSQSNLQILHKRSLGSDGETNNKGDSSVTQPGEANASSGAHCELVAGLAIAPFAYGKPQKIRFEDDKIFCIILSQEAHDLFRSCGTLEITMAYRLESRPVGQSWKDFTVDPSEVDTMSKTLSNYSERPYQRISFSHNQHFDFVIRRNLEHILSVCSIPISDYSSDSDTDSTCTSTTSAGDMNVALALTCGDISGHRVTSSASFFAFRFLVSIFQYLTDSSKVPRDYISGNQSCCCEQTHGFCPPCDDMDNQIQHLQQRIRMTCHSHIRWVYKQADSEDETISHSYWATGKCIPGWDTGDYMRVRALTDTPFQVIKVQTIMNTEKLDGYQIYLDDASHSLNSKFQSWIRRLEEDDERARFAFSRPTRDGTKTFYLADHFWIHQALKFIICESPQSPGPKEAGAYMSERLFPDELRRSMLRRFTIVNPDTRKRMLATSRTSLETRFHLHSTDTALLYAMNSGFFDKPPVRRYKGGDRARSRGIIEEWKSTLDAQAEYEDNQTLDGNNPLQYALALIMCSMKRRFNRKDTNEVARVAKEVLLKSTSQNGLFPGLFKEKGEPTIFQDEQDRDHYWNVTFELPFILWAYGRNLFTASLTPDTDQSKSKGGSALHHSFSGETGEEGGGRRLLPFMKTTVPFSNFNNVIDEGGIVEFSDDWLQKGPRFLKFAFTPEAFRFKQAEEYDEPRQETSRNKFLRQGRSHDGDSRDVDWESSVNVSGAGQEEKASLALNEQDFSGTCETLKVAREFYQSAGTIGDETMRGAIIDIPQGSDGSEIGQNMTMTNDRIFRTFAKKRRVQDAKKRLIWLPKGDKMTALMCFLAAPELERDNMSAFIDRHASYDKFFYDGVAPFQNEWETELHLSYFSLLGHDPGILSDGGTIPYLSYVVVEQPPNGEKSLLGIERPKTLARSTMSFRFVGDFSDRYWTCHVLEFDPNHDGCPNSLLSLLPKTGVASIEHPEDGYRPRNPWQQRRVLELLIFDQMLKRIRADTGAVLSWVRSEVSDAPRRDGKPMSEHWPGVRRKLECSALGRNPLPRDESFLTKFRAELSGSPFQLLSTYPLNPLAEALHHDIRSKELKGSDGYFSRAKLWQFFETILQTVEDDLEENLEKIEKWSRREEDRGLQKPRWTRNDERRYGSVIKTLRFQTETEIHELHRLKRSIRAFREPRSSKVSSLRDDINLLSTENVNLFTYVTVIFLPLGFATGIFSMSNAPETETLVAMVCTAIIAIHLTIGALVNAKHLMNVFYVCSKTAIFHPVYFFLRFVYLPITDTWLGSRLLRVFETLRDRAERLRIFDEAQKGYNAHKMDARKYEEVYP